MGILIGVFSVVIFMDWRYYRIPNKCIIAGIITGLVVTYMSEKAVGVAESFAAMSIIFLAFYPFYLLGGIGAGDIKLFMMTGCFIRGDAFLHYMLATMITAAAFSIFKMMLYTESRERLWYLLRYIRKSVLTGVLDEYHIDKTRKKSVIRLSIPAFISLLMLCAGVYS